jgi:chorismate mutase
MQPPQCSTIDDVRQAVDEIDRQIRDLFMQRAAYAERAEQLTPASQPEAAPEHVLLELERLRTR